MGATMLLQTKLNPQPADPMQARIMMLLPLMFIFLFATFPAGLVIYWTWNNVLSIAQQWLIMKRMGVSRLRPWPAPDSPDDPAERSRPGACCSRRPCTFVAGVAELDRLPPAGLPEVAFGGRSNVGKSSLINALTGRRALARISQTPGRTQQINLFDLGCRLVLADLPGYGYAEAPKGTVAAWQRLVRQYLRGRSALRRTCVLVDARHGFKEVDREFMSMLGEAAVAYQVVLTKVDQLRAGEVPDLLATVAAELARKPGAHPLPIATSARDGSGIAELRGALAALAAEAAR